MMKSEYVILVDQKDKEIGTMEKLAAHEKGLLHRAFSVFLFNQNGETLLQKRSLSKYHSPGLWTNSCCSHPRTGESIEQACRRRVREELGITIDAFDRQKSFIYKKNVGKGLIEHELDHIVFGEYQKNNITPNPMEVYSYKWIKITKLKEDIQNKPEQYTEWLKVILDRFMYLLLKYNKAKIYDSEN